MWTLCSILDLMPSEYSRPIVLMINNKMDIRIMKPVISFDEMRKMSIAEIEKIMIRELQVKNIK